MGLSKGYNLRFFNVFFMGVFCTGCFITCLTFYDVTSFSLIHKIYLGETKLKTGTSEHIQSQDATSYNFSDSRQPVLCAVAEIPIYFLSQQRLRTKEIYNFLLTNPLNEDFTKSLVSKTQ